MSNDFTAVYDLYREAILRYCCWKSRDPDVGQDLMQETFLRYWISMQDKNKKQIQHVRAFLYRIAHNLFVSHVRRRKESSLDQLVEAGFEPAIDPWKQTHSRLDAEKPLEVLSGMPDRYKQAITSRFILGLAPADIAGITGETPNTVSLRIHRGLKHLKSLLRSAQARTPGDLHLRRPQATFSFAETIVPLALA